jgi:hypothetical protein
VCTWVIPSTQGTRWEDQVLDQPAQASKTPPQKKHTYIHTYISGDEDERKLRGRKKGREVGEKRRKKKE